jgi:hypothetical protein
MNCSRYLQAGVALLVTAVACGGAGCSSKTLRDGRSPAYLIIDRLQASPGAEDEFDDTLESDVQTNGSIFEDSGRVQMRVALKDAGTPTSPTEPSVNNAITVDRYHVSYTRSDGRNTPGVDVPFAFDGAVTGTITKNPVTLGFVMVRAQAKAEAPLRNLRGAGGAMLISTIAEVTFYGRDQVGNAVSVSGRISVNFADWADPSGGQ